MASQFKQSFLKGFLSIGLHQEDALRNDIRRLKSHRFHIGAYSWAQAAKDLKDALEAETATLSQPKARDVAPKMVKTRAVDRNLAQERGRRAKY